MTTGRHASRGAAGGEISWAEAVVESHDLSIRFGQLGRRTKKNHPPAVGIRARILASVDFDGKVARAVAIKIAPNHRKIVREDKSSKTLKVCAATGEVVAKKNRRRLRG